MASLPMAAVKLKIKASSSMMRELQGRDRRPNRDTLIHVGSLAS